MTASEENNKTGGNGYRNILKGTSVFGGVQVFLILINLIRGKFVALSLGPEGMGISSLFSSAFNTIVRGSSLGLNLALVKEVSQNSDDRTRFGNVLAVVYRLMWVTALGGAIFCALFSRWLSQLTFHTPDYAWQFVLLAVAVFFTLAGGVRFALMQGLRQVRRISLSSLVGALTGLVAGVPLYYFFGDKGIVPAIVVLSLTTFLFYYWNTRSLRTDVRFSWKEHRGMVRQFLALGFVLMASDMIGTIGTYVLNIFLERVGGVDSVGLFQSANSITSQYMGAVFAALSLEYFPRLSKVASDNARMCDVVNRQSLIVVLVMAPLAIAMILTAPLLIRLLLTDRFMPVLGLVRWMGLGIFLCAMQFPLGYISFAKNNKRVFFLLEGVLTNVLTIGGNMLSFYLWGLEGIGYSVVAVNLLSLGIYYVVNHRLYDYSFSGAVCREYLLGTLLCAAALLASLQGEDVGVYLTMGGLCLLSVAYSIWRLRSLMKSDENGNEG